MFHFHFFHIVIFLSNNLKYKSSPKFDTVLVTMTVSRIFSSFSENILRFRANILHFHILFVLLVLVVGAARCNVAICQIGEALDTSPSKSIQRELIFKRSLEWIDNWRFDAANPFINFSHCESEETIIAYEIDVPYLWGSWVGHPCSSQWIYFSFLYAVLADINS